MNRLARSQWLTLSETSGSGWLSWWVFHYDSRAKALIDLSPTAKLPTIVMCLAPLVMYLGRNRYTRSPPGGSVAATAFKIIGYCARGRWLKPKALFAKDFWDRAKPSMIPEADRPAWMTFDDGQ